MFVLDFFGDSFREKATWRFGSLSSKTFWKWFLGRNFGLKALDKRTLKSTQVLDLRSTCVSFGHPLASTCIDLRRLARTCVDFGRAQIWTQVDTNFFYRLATLRKSTQVDRNNLLLWKRINQWYAWNLRLFATYKPTCESVWPPFASRTQVLVLQTCVDLRRLASPFGQGLKDTGKYGSQAPLSQHVLNA